MRAGLSLPSSKGRSGPDFAAVAGWLLLAAILALTVLTRLDSYLLFHAIVEIFSIVIAFGVFIVAWNSDQLVKNSYLLILGVGSLFIGIIDTVHTLAFQGMGVFVDSGANLPTQLWVAGRYLQAITWLIAPFFLGRNVRRYPTAIAYAAATFLLLATVFVWKIFPTAYVDGLGLTPFKTISEYVIIAILAAAIGLLWWRRSQFDSTVLAWLIGSGITAIASEFAFTLYVGVTDAANLIGHVFKILEFYFLYRALVEIGFTRPYSLLFRQMKRESEAQLEHERGRAEARAAELDAIFSSMVDGVALYAPDGSVIRMNESARRLFSFSNASPDQPLSLRAKLHSFIDEHGQPIDKLSDMPLGKALRGETVREMVLGLPKVGSGELLWLAFSAVPICDAAGQQNGAVVTFRDITERMEAAEEVAQLNLELERLVRDRTAMLETTTKELETFAYSVSHDLRAPLREIDGFVDLLQNQAQPTLTDQWRHYMSRIAGSAREMGMLIDDLLLFSRLSRTEMQKVSVDLAQLVQDVIGQAGAEAKGRHVEWNVAALPCVTGDQAMLHTALSNLISNALKFTRPCPDAKIEIGAVPDDRAGIVVFVRDNGVGFSMKDAGKLFGVFQRLHHTDEFEGSGIGLANVRRIISRHGGRTWAEGQVNGGATFYFSLPSVE